jgi:hypothetical protein
VLDVLVSSIKTALLTFIHKSGDPLEYAHYRGINLLRCLFKIITGTLNGRLQNMLHKHTGINTNQGANQKGVHAAHKAAVLMNVIADARTNKKPLHIIYTDIKGAFPSVPYQAFTDALTSFGLADPFWILFTTPRTISQLLHAGLPDTHQNDRSSMAYMKGIA